ncbi:MAG: UvrB/UvrC motif-containing protein [Puniceicoccales bacterium]|jgi:protein arginine kinase activator|nr:UvrB/UvrC motif-containing protein [Puniceicoccales bacterium]
MKKCQICGKPATVHFTQIVNNEMQNVDLCDECAVKNGLLEHNGSPLSVLAALGEAMFGNFQQNSVSNGLICPSCGCTPTIFKETGRLGCEDCYKGLRPLIEKIVENSQKGVEHVGKRPAVCLRQENADSAGEFPVSGSGTGRCDARDLDSLKFELERAISEERYEDAAILRDEIKNILTNL